MTPIEPFPFVAVSLNFNYTIIQWPVQWIHPVHFSLTWPKGPGFSD